MKMLYSNSPLARAIAGVSLAASIIGSAGAAAATTCTLPFPSKNAFCAGGSSVAKINHERFVNTGGFFRLALSLDWQGGTVGAVAYGIDVNGNQLNFCATEVADADNRVNRTKSIPCSQLHAGQPGTVFPAVVYDHDVDIRSTAVFVF